MTEQQQLNLREEIAVGRKNKTKRINRDEEASSVRVARIEEIKNQYYQPIYELVDSYILNTAEEVMDKLLKIIAKELYDYELNGGDINDLLATSRFKDWIRTQIQQRTSQSFPYGMLTLAGVL